MENKNKIGCEIDEYTPDWYDEPGDTRKLKAIEKYRNHNNAEMEADLATLEFKIIRSSQGAPKAMWNSPWRAERRKISDEIDDIIMEQARRIHGGTDTERKLWRGKN